MGLKRKWEQFRSDWDAAGQALEAAEKRRAAKNARQARPEGTCRQHGCPRDAAKDGYCRGCWAAIFGGCA